MFSKFQKHWYLIATGKRIRFRQLKNLEWRLKSGGQRYLKRFYEIFRGSLIEVDAALDIAVDLGYATKQGLETAGRLMVRSFQLISKMISCDREAWVVGRENAGL